MRSLKNCACGSCKYGYIVFAFVRATRREVPCSFGLILLKTTQKPKDAHCNGTALPYHVTALS